MWYRVNADALNIRRGPGASYQDIGDFIRSDVLEIAETTSGWGRAAAWYRGTTQQMLPDALNSWCSMAYLIVTDPPVVTPPPPATLPKFDVAITSTEADVNSVSVNGVMVYTKP